MRKQIAAANWKMNLTYQEGQDLLDKILAEPIEPKDHHEVVFGVPFPYLIMAKEKVANLKNYHIAAQNCYNKKAGAYTGEVSVDMLKSINISHCIIGHSERREYFSESNQMLAEKLDLLLAANITPIFCCGEPLDIREAGKQNEFVEKQLQESLFHLSAEELKRSSLHTNLFGLLEQAKRLQRSRLRKFMRTCVLYLQENMAKKWPMKFLFYMVEA